MAKRKYFQNLNENTICSKMISQNGVKALLPKSWRYQKVSVNLGKLTLISMLTTRILLYIQSKIENVNKVYSLIPIILGLGLAAMTHPIGLIEQQVYANLYGKSSSDDVITIAYPSSTPSNSKITNQDNLIASKSHKDNPIQIQSNHHSSLSPK